MGFLLVVLFSEDVAVVLLLLFFEDVLLSFEGTRVLLFLEEEDSFSGRLF